MKEIGRNEHVVVVPVSSDELSSLSVKDRDYTQHITVMVHKKPMSTPEIVQMIIEGIEEKE